jgi:hypothetical protein
MIIIIKHDYHRNGNGVGFHSIIFKDHGRILHATLFDEKGYCAVHDPSKLVEQEVLFGENSFRGDYYEPYLRLELELSPSETETVLSNR